MKPLSSRSEAGSKGGRGNKANDNINSFSGTSKEYILARLKRDAPEIAHPDALLLRSCWPLIVDELNSESSEE